MLAVDKNTGAPITGTLESLYASAQIEPGSFERSDDGKPRFTHDGYTKPEWHGQKTVTDKHGPVFLTADGDRLVQRHQARRRRRRSDRGVKATEMASLAEVPVAGRRPMGARVRGYVGLRRSSSAFPMVGRSARRRADARWRDDDRPDRLGGFYGLTPTFGSAASLRGPFVRGTAKGMGHRVSLDSPRRA